MPKGYRKDGAPAVATGEKNPNWRGGVPKKKCRVCLAEFGTAYSKTRKYCSYKCASSVNGPKNGKLVRFSKYRRPRKDFNHATIVLCLQSLGCDVMDTSSLGGGIPDLVVTFRGETHWVEIKNPDTAYGRAGLSKSQQNWARRWKGGPVVVVRTEQDVEALVKKWSEE